MQKRRYYLLFNQFFLLAGAVIALFSSNSSIPISENDMLQLEAHLPGIQPIDSSKPDIHITHYESNTFEMNQEGSHVELQEKWDHHLSPDFLHLLYGLARREWLNRGIFPIHAACVGFDEGYVLLVGHSGAGKTSTTLECALNHNLQIFSGDKTLVKIDEKDTMLALAGTKAMTVRSHDRNRWDAMMSDYVDSDARRTFRLKPHFCSPDENVEIKAIVILQLNDGKKSCERLPNAIHTLYPYFMDMERADTLLRGGAGLVDGSIDPEVKRTHVPKLARSVEKIPTFKIIGSMNYVSEKIERLVR